MLDNLPPEILEQILGYLPSVSSILSVDRVNHKLHAAISANQYAIFRQFVQRAFPTITTPPLWRDMAHQLSSRSRAWERRAFIARECCPDLDEPYNTHGIDLSFKFGYTPVIDSYEEYTGGSIDTTRNVLAFGAAGRLRLRITDGHETRWKSLQLPDDHLPQNDIVDLRLLRPKERLDLNGEVIVVQRADKSITKVQSIEDSQSFTEVTQYVTATSRVDCMDVSSGIDARLAVLDKSSIQLFPLHSVEAQTQPICSTKLKPTFKWQNIRRCVSFLTNETIATSVRFVQGSDRAPILIYNVRPTDIVSTPLHQIQSQPLTGASLRGRQSATVLTKLDSVGHIASRPGQVFLSGWTDGCIRMHDLRTPKDSLVTYYDPVDDGKILSLATCGHEKFFAGSHQNGCLKMFDMRMPGARPYSYLDITADQKPRSAYHSDTSRNIMGSCSTNVPNGTIRPLNRREINIFVTPLVQPGGRLWEPLPRQETIEQTSTRGVPNSSRGSRGSRRNQRGGYQQRLTRYRGSLYSLSIPSPSSSTLYAGIENHVIQLDFVNTDDIRRQTIRVPTMRAGNNRNHDTDKHDHDQILNLSCYERPRAGHESTDAVLLRKQVSFNSTHNNRSTRGSGLDSEKLSSQVEENDEVEEAAEAGWDERWRLGQSWKDRRRHESSLT